MEQFQPEAVINALGRKAMQVISLTDLSERQQRKIADLETLVDQLRYENHILKEACSDNVDAERFQKAETVIIPAEEFMPHDVRIVSPKQ